MWGRSSAPSGSSSTLPHVMLEVASSAPDRTFLEVWDEERGVLLKVQFGEFAHQALAAAHWLRESCGISPEQSCAFYAHNSVAYLALSFGTMALGARSVNLNWRNAVATNRVLVGDLQPRVLLFSVPYKSAATDIHNALGTRIVLIESICNGQPGQLPFDSASPALPSAAVAANASSVAAVFFTGGTTGTPKAVPHTHAGLLWIAQRLRTAVPEPFEDAVDNRGTVCFTPFFHVMGFVANTVFNLVNGCRAALLASHEARLSPSLIVAAVRELRPSCVNTVPWIVEGLVAAISDGDAEAIDAVSSLHLLTYGGAALAPHCPPVLREHGVRVACTYGQTELAGPVMYGKPNGDPNALQPFTGVSYELVRGPDDGEGEGEPLSPARTILYLERTTLVPSNPATTRLLTR
jgi:acyl-CoA synthetase (AMP-forming)/AMP-acid ligase II